MHDAVQAAQQAFGRALDAKCNGDDGKVAPLAKAAVRMTSAIKQLLMDHLTATLPLGFKFTMTSGNRHVPSACWCVGTVPGAQCP